MIRMFIIGMLLGVANIIPGVSGGTMAVVVGIYDRLIADLCKFNLKTIQDLKELIQSKDKLNKFKELWQSYDLSFLSTLTVGAILAILLLSKVITYLLKSQHDPTYGFFFGLIIMSIWIPFKMLNRKSFREFITLAFGIIAPLLLAMALSSEEKVNVAQKKNKIKNKEVATQSSDKTKEEDKAAPIQDPHSASRLAFIFLCGAIAISAMILPGISGSFLMIVFGVYFDILKAIQNFDFLTLTIFAVGCGVGLLGFVRLLNVLMKSYRDPTIAFLIGLMLGSLWNIWPFKATEIVGNQTIYLHNIIPANLDINTLLTLGSTLVGIAIVFSFIIYEAKHPAEEKHGKA